MIVAKTSFLIYTDTNERGCANGANDVTAYAVNEVMLRINDVALSAECSFVNDVRLKKKNKSNEFVKCLCMSY